MYIISIQQLPINQLKQWQKLIVVTKFSEKGKKFEENTNYIRIEFVALSTQYSRSYNTTIYVRPTPMATGMEHNANTNIIHSLNYEF